MKPTKLIFAISIALIVTSCSNNGGLTFNLGNYPSGDKYTDYGENPFLKTSDQSVSTFSVDADGGSYANMRRYLYIGENPPQLRYALKNISITLPSTTLNLKQTRIFH